MTFLEFVAFQLLGPPTYSKGDGESYWPCQKCGKFKFHTRPEKPGEKDRFSCWVCGWYGDEYDLLRHFFPHGHYGQRKEQVAVLKQEYDDQCLEKETFLRYPRKARAYQIAAAEAGGEQLAIDIFFSPGSGRGVPRAADDDQRVRLGLPERSTDPACVVNAWKDLSEKEKTALRVAWKVIKRLKVDFDALAIECLEEQEWYDLRDMMHRWEEERVREGHEPGWTGEVDEDEEDEEEQVQGEQGQGQDQEEQHQEARGVQGNGQGNGRAGKPVSSGDLRVDVLACMFRKGSWPSWRIALCNRIVVTSEEIASKLGVSEVLVRDILDILQEDGYVRQNGDRSGWYVTSRQPTSMTTTTKTTTTAAKMIMRTNDGVPVYR
jgi:hypothetical protein